MSRRRRFTEPLIAANPLRRALLLPSRVTIEMMFSLYSPEGRALGGLIGVAALISLANILRLVAEFFS